MARHIVDYNTPLNKIDGLDADVMEIVRHELTRVGKAHVAGEVVKLGGKSMRNIEKVLKNKTKYEAFINIRSKWGNQISAGIVNARKKNNIAPVPVAAAAANYEPLKENFLVKRFNERYQEIMSMPWDQVSEYLQIVGLNPKQVNAVKRQVEEYVRADREVGKREQIDINSGDVYEFGCQTDAELAKCNGIGDKSIEGINEFCKDLVDHELNRTGMWTSQKQVQQEEEVKVAKRKVGAPIYGLVENRIAVESKTSAKMENRKYLRTAVSGDPLRPESAIEDLCLRYDTWHALKRWGIDIVGELEGHTVDSLMTPKNGLHWARIADLVQSIYNNPDAIAMMPHIKEEMDLLEQVGARPLMYEGLRDGMVRDNEPPTYKSSNGPRHQPENGFVRQDKDGKPIDEEDLYAAQTEKIDRTSFVDMDVNTDKPNFVDMDVNTGTSDAQPKAGETKKGEPTRTREPQYTHPFKDEVQFTAALDQNHIPQAIDFRILKDVRLVGLEYFDDKHLKNIIDAYQEFYDKRRELYRRDSSRHNAEKHRTLHKEYYKEAIKREVSALMDAETGFPLDGVECDDFMNAIDIAEQEASDSIFVQTDIDAGNKIKHFMGVVSNILVYKNEKLKNAREAAEKRKAEEEARRIEEERKLAERNSLMDLYSSVIGASEA